MSRERRLPQHVLAKCPKQPQAWCGRPAVTIDMTFVCPVPQSICSVRAGAVHFHQFSTLMPVVLIGNPTAFHRSKPCDVLQKTCCGVLCPEMQLRLVTFIGTVFASKTKVAPVSLLTIVVQIWRSNDGHIPHRLIKERPRLRSAAFQHGGIGCTAIVQLQTLA
jgi:hypothetical protein